MRIRIVSASITAATGLAVCALGLSGGMSTAALDSTFEQQNINGQILYYWHGTKAGLLLGAGGNMRIDARRSNGAREIELQFRGASPDCIPRGESPEMVQVRYYNETNPGGVARPHFRRVRYRNLYPGIDLIFYANRGSPEFDLELAPGASPEQIRIGYGTAAVGLTESGDIEVRAGKLRMTQRPPLVRQMVNGSAVSISSRYVLEDTGLAGVRMGPYNPTLPLTIDPILNFTADLGGQGFDAAYAMALDAAGAIYVAGETDSLSFGGAGQRSNFDAFVAKLDPTGSQILYATYFGGSGTDIARGIAVDTAGNVYVTGTTDSQNFPTTTGVVGPTNAGLEDAFVVKLSPSGAILYATMLGSSGDDLSAGIAIDASGNVYITGQTNASFPVTSGALQTTNRGGNDCFVTKLNATATSLVYSTMLGGSGDDFCRGIAVDSAGNAYVTGVTYSADFPVQGAPQTALRGEADAFIAKINASGTAIVYSTFLGGDSFDEANAIAIDGTGAAYVAGDTLSWNFPTTSAAIQSTLKGGYDAFVAKISPAGDSFVYATMLGGSATDSATAIAVDAANRAVVAGFTNSSDFPVQQALQTLGGGFDAFVAVLDSSGSTLQLSTYLGGAGDDRAYATAAGSGNSIYLTGATQSAAFPQPAAPQGLRPGTLLSASAGTPSR